MTLDVEVVLPSTKGDYRVAITLVQEAFAWFDELSPGCTFVMPLRVG